MSSLPETPRQHKERRSRLPGIRQIIADVSKISETIRNRLNLNYEPEIWQTTLIRRIAEGYDSIFVAGTGYGKSLIFEGLAAFEKRKLVIVICPLKALEMDQVLHAQEKGLKAIAINQDTIAANSNIWERLLKEEIHLLYLSPELAVSPGSKMHRYWKNARFMKKISAIFIDEAHCIDVWGEEFRKEYRELKFLRNYTGFEIPIICCSATIPTSTFDLIWTSLEYGKRPFWGLDVGVDRPNLFYTVRSYTKIKDIFRYIMNVLPSVISIKTSTKEIPKTIIYLPTPELCIQLTQDLRRLLPASLRSSVQHFSAGLSQKGKNHIWKSYSEGQIRILISTEATAMGCNDPSIQYCFVVLYHSDPKTLSNLVQRWGRTARKRDLHGSCLFFVPSWAFRPVETSQKPRKTANSKRSKLSEPLEGFINVEACGRHYLNQYFRPDTGLDVYESLEHDSAALPKSRGRRSLSAPHINMTWTVLDLERRFITSECCWKCNPEFNERLVPLAREYDHRIFAFKDDFVFQHPSLKAEENSISEKSHSASSRVESRASTPVSSTRTRTTHNMSKESQNNLRNALQSWREESFKEFHGSFFMTPRMFMPDKVINQIMESAPLLASLEITLDVLKSKITWSLGTEELLMALMNVINEWKSTATRDCEPPSERDKKKLRQANSPRTIRAKKVMPPPVYHELSQTQVGSDVQTPFAKPTSKQTVAISPCQNLPPSTPNCRPVSVISGSPAQSHRLNVQRLNTPQTPNIISSTYRQPYTYSHYPIPQSSQLVPPPLIPIPSLHSGTFYIPMVPAIYSYNPQVPYPYPAHYASPSLYHSNRIPAQSNAPPPPKAPEPA